jgi:hypothetical protein
MEIDVKRNLLFQHPFTMMIAGATSSGKTFFTRSLIENLPELMTGTYHLPLRVLWCYGIYQELYDVPLSSRLVTVTYHEGVPEDDSSEYDVIVLDDMMADAGDDKRISEIFTKGSHHKNMSVIFIVQNVFYQGKQMRNITLNCHYLVLMKNRRDLAQVTRIGSQIYPGSKRLFFVDAYKKAVLDTDYGYLLIDLTPTTLEEFRLRTNILPHQYPIVIFMPKHVGKSKSMPSLA